MAEPAKSYQATVHSINGELEKRYNSPILNTDGTDGTLPDMTERLAKLEGQFEGHKLVQTITVSIVGTLAAVLIAISIFLVTQNIGILARVNELPAKMSADLKSDLRDLNQTMLQAITATKQAPPQVILMPTPDRPSPPTPAPKAQ